MRHFIFCTIVCFMLSSCCILTNNATKKLYFNQSKEEVEQILGKPDAKAVFYSKEYYVYYIHSDIYDLFLNRSKFPYIGIYPFLRTGKEFWVVFENNNLIYFGKADILGNKIKMN